MFDDSKEFSMTTPTTLDSTSLPWTLELIPELSETASEKEILMFIACALRRQLQITMPPGAAMVDGELVLP